MIRLITGTPGSGKTLYAISEIVKERKNNPERKIYCDIKGIKIDGILPAPDDWRDAEEGSLIIYDECQYRPMFKKSRGANKFQSVLDLTTHRHTGKDIWFITQTPNFLHNDLLALVGEHFHLDRPYGASVSNLYRWRHAEIKPNGTTVKDRAESRTPFKFDKKLFELYDSVDVDDDKANHKTFKFPILKTIPLMIGFLLIAYFFYATIRDGGILTPKNTPANETKQQMEGSHEENTQKNPAHAHHRNTGQNLLQDTALDSTPSTIDTHALHKKYLQPYTYEVAHDDVVRPALVAQMGNECKAYNQYGDLLNIDDKLCKSMLKEYGTKPRARRIFNEYQAQNSQLNATKPSISPTQADKAVLPPS